MTEFDNLPDFLDLEKKLAEQVFEIYEKTMNEDLKVVITYIFTCLFNIRSQTLQIMTNFKPFLDSKPITKKELQVFVDLYSKKVNEELRRQEEEAKKISNFIV